MKRISFLLISSVLLIVVMPSSHANASVHTILGEQGARKWFVSGDSFFEVATTNLVGDVINDNGLDANSLRVTFDSVVFISDLAVFGDSEYSAVAAGWGFGGDSLDYQFEKNWVKITAASSNSTNFKINNDLGSDLDTTFTTINNKLFSYKKNGNNIGSAPIFQWVTDGILTNSISDIVQIDKIGTSLNLQLYVYAHDISSNLLVNRVDYLQQFALFAEEDVNRTDTFIYVATPVPPSPVEILVRKNTNLQFNESLFGSDKLSDPDGQLRKTIDAIDAKYAYLIK